MQLTIPMTVLEEATTGAVELERVAGGFAPHRLARWTRIRQHDDAIERMAAQTLGVRLRFLTAADSLELVLRVTRLTENPSIPARPATFLAEVDGELVDRIDLDKGDFLVVGADGSRQLIPGAVSRVRFELGDSAGRERAVTIWLPHTAEVELLGGSASAVVDVAPPQALTRWVHHGSSISHGGEADGPWGPWAQQVARELDYDLTDLAFAGNAMLDPFVADTIASLPADLITLKLGINVVNADAMRSRAFVPALHGFLDRVRAAHPATPIVVISPIFCPGHETIPGPTREVRPGWYAGVPREVEWGDGTLTLRVVRELLGQAIPRREDPALALVDGLALLGEAEDELLVDGLHPGQAGHDLMAQRFIPLLNDTGLVPDRPSLERAGG